MMRRATPDSIQPARFGLSLAALLCVAFLSGALVTEVKAQVSVRHTLTLPSYDTLELGGVLLGQSVTDTLYLLNGFPAPIDTTLSIQLQNDSFASLSQHPNAITKDSTGKVVISLSAVSAGIHITQLVVFPLTDDSLKGKATILLRYEGILETKDSATFNLIHDASSVIAFRTTDSTASVEINLKNNSTKPDTITGLLVNSVFFKLLSPPALPLILAPDGLLPLNVAMTLLSPGFATAALIVSAPDEPILPFSIQAVRVPPSKVTQQIEPAVFMSMYPNPARDMVTLHAKNINRLHITLTDVLGQVIRDDNVPNEWVWDGKSSAGIAAPAGTYYVFASGILPSGKYVQQVLPLILMK